MSKTEATLAVQPASDMHGGIVPALGAPGTIARVAESGSEIEWVPPGTGALAIGETTGAEGQDLPFDIPWAGLYGSPSLEFIGAPAVAGDRFLVSGWFEVSEGLSTDGEVRMALLLDGTPVHESGVYKIAADETKPFSYQVIYTFASDNETPEFQMAIRAFAAGLTSPACVASITRLAPLEE